MIISIVTLFPQMFLGPFSESIIKNATQKKLVEINFIDIRKFGIGKHQLVDDTAYGGGVGMVMRVDVVHAAIAAARKNEFTSDEEKVILMTADGNKYNQNNAKTYSSLKHLIIVCGHYEGIDERIRSYVDEEISIGDFVLTGGEIPAMLITDSVVRLVSGVLKDEATTNESFSLSSGKELGLLEYPIYTRPEEYNGEKVPDILLSGNHAKIDEWKKQEAIKKTLRKRPDILNN